MTTDEMLEALELTAAEIKKAELVVDEARSRRDDLIRAIVGAGLGATVVALYAGLTRQSVYNVVSRS